MAYTSARHTSLACACLLTIASLPALAVGASAPSNRFLGARDFGLNQEENLQSRSQALLGFERPVEFSADTPSNTAPGDQAVDEHSEYTSARDREAIPTISRRGRLDERGLWREWIFRKPDERSRHGRLRGVVEHATREPHIRFGGSERRLVAGGRRQGERECHGRQSHPRARDSHLLQSIA